MEFLLDPEFVRKLRNLTLLTRGRFRSYLSGRRGSPRSGMSLEFAEYKEYHPGDDLRYVDWNLYGRLGELFIKVFTREEDVPIYILLDVSRSMEIGGKLRAAARLAGVLAYLGLKDLNRVGIFPFAAEMSEGVPPRGGYRQIFHVFRFLQDVEPAGETSVNASLARFTRVRREGGLVVLISDMLSEGGFREGLTRLVHHRHEVTVLHLLAPEDLDPDLKGELQLLNVEDLAELPLHVDGEALSAYQTELSRYRNELETYCRQYGLRYYLLSSGTPLEEIVFKTLREGALLA